MRKKLTLLLSILLLMALAGCNSNPPAAQVSQSASPETEAAVESALPVMNPVPEPETTNPPESGNPISNAFGRIISERNDEILGNVIFAYLGAIQWRDAYFRAEQQYNEHRIVNYAQDRDALGVSAYEYAIFHTQTAEEEGIFYNIERFYQLLIVDYSVRLKDIGREPDFYPDEEELYKYLNSVNYAGAISEHFENIDLFSVLNDKSNPMPALAALHDEDIILYYCEFGAVLSVKGEQIFYPWRDFLTPRGILPRLSLLDANGDGLDELAVILYTGSGTGIAVEELHLVGLHGDARFDDLHVTSREIKDQLFHRLSAQYDMKKDTIDVKLDNQTLSIDVSDAEKVKSNEFNGLDLDSIIHFNAEDGSLSVHLTIGLSGFDHIVPFDYVDLIAGLKFDTSGNITLVDPRLEYMY